MSPVVSITAAVVMLRPVVWAEASRLPPRDASLVPRDAENWPFDPFSVTRAAKRVCIQAQLTQFRQRIATQSGACHKKDDKGSAEQDRSQR
jgi:hypothetical protein